MVLQGAYFNFFFYEHFHSVLRLEILLILLGSFVAILFHNIGLGLANTGLRLESSYLNLDSDLISWTWLGHEFELDGFEYSQGTTRHSWKLTTSVEVIMIEGRLDWTGIKVFVLIPKGKLVEVYWGFELQFKQSAIISWRVLWQDFFFFFDKCRRIAGNGGSQVHSQILQHNVIHERHHFVRRVASRKIIGIKVIGDCMEVVLHRPIFNLVDRNNLKRVF